MQMANFENRFLRIVAALSRLEQAADMTLLRACAENPTDPIAHLADAAARKNEGDGYTLSERQNTIAFRLKSGKRVYADENAIDGSRDIDQMKAVDLISFATCLSSSANKNYVLIRYDQLACYANPFMKTTDDVWDFWCADKGGLMSESRSVVIDAKALSEKRHAIASLPYYKFRNLGESAEYSLDNVRSAIEASDGRFIATEKLDGSMIQMRYIESEDKEGGVFEDGLLVSTSKVLIGSDKAEENAHIAAVSRCHLKDKDERRRFVGIAKSHPNLTFIYEFVNPKEDRHVVSYPPEKYGMYLTGARDIMTGKLVVHSDLLEMARPFDIMVPDVVASDIDSAIKYQKTGDGSSCEGMVAAIGKDKTWLVKIKLEEFTELSNIINSIDGGSGFKSICKMTIANTIDDAIPGMPDVIKTRVENTVKELSEFDEEMDCIIDEIMEKAPDATEDRKAFAKYVNELACPNGWKKWLFAKANGHDIGHFWADRKGDGWRFIGECEFEKRKEELSSWKKRR